MYWSLIPCCCLADTPWTWEWCWVMWALWDCTWWTATLPLRWPVWGQPPPSPASWESPSPQPSEVCLGIFYCLLTSINLKTHFLVSCHWKKKKGNKFNLNFDVVVKSRLRECSVFYYAFYWGFCFEQGLTCLSWSLCSTATLAGLCALKDSCWTTTWWPSSVPWLDPLELSYLTSCVW